MTERVDKWRLFWYTVSVIFRTKFTRYCAFVYALTALGTSNAFAFGFFLVDSSAFLRRAVDRADHSTTIAVGPNLEDESLHFAWKVDLQAYTFLSDRSSFTLEAANMYLATSHDWDSDHQFTIGRRYYNWSIGDKTWSTGMWQPRFLWDPLRPEQIGLTGAFYTYEGEAMTLLLFASPIAVPERGFPTRADTSGRIVSPSPFWVQPPEQVVLQGRATNIRYSIPNPDIKKAIFRPGTAAQIRLGKTMGAWTALSYGFVPMYPLDIAIDPLLYLPTNEFQTSLYPRFHSRHMGTFEAGYTESAWRLWVSASADRVVVKPPPNRASAQVITRPIGPAFVGMAGGQVRFFNELDISGAVMAVEEKTPAPDAASAIFATDDLQWRFNYARAWQLGATWESNSPWILDSRFIQDIHKESWLSSFDVIYRPKRFVTAGPYTGGFNSSGNGWSIGVGADFLNSRTGSGWIGQYDGNDRIRARFSYAF